MANWLDKYDTPKAQNGIEGTMGGLTDKGFNYNGAWGGQFQMGGNVYPVNYVPQAQDGLETLSPRQKRGIELLIKKTKEKKPASLKQQPMLSQDKRTDFEREYDEQKGRAKERKRQFREAILTPADVATDILQLGNFIPHPYARIAGEIGNVAGTLVDAYQASMDFNEENYGSGAFNLGSAILPSFIKRAGYTRDMYNTNPGSIADKIASLGNRSGSYIPLTTLPRAISPVTIKGVNYNRGLLGTLGAETYMDIPKERTGGSIPGSTGFTYARTGSIPSEGPYAKKTMPSAQNGQEMRYYQEGLDWRPKTISRNGGWLDGYDKAQRGSKIKRTDEASKAVKRSFEITEKPANWIENYFNKALYAITPDYESVEDREKLFKRYRPINYPNVVSAISGLVKDSQLPERDIEGDLNIGEEAWRKALNLPVKEKYIIPSAYKPTKYTDSNSKYYTLNNIIDKEKILAKAKKLGIKPGQKINLESMAPYIKEGFMDVDKFSNIDPLQKFQIDMDPEGKYISIYDKYDFDFAPANKVITPYEFYDRFYLNDKDIPKAKPIVNKLSNKKKEGGIIKDDRGQWAHPGEITEINSPYITMKGVPYPVLGVSDEGDVQLMQPEQEYKFKGKKVREYPMAKNGINNLDAKPLQKLNQLTNFTNYNTKQPGGWMDKYQ
jgi:hypothetical protein